MARLTFVGCVLGVACAGISLAHAQQGGDLQARILYAYHAEDTNQLTSLAQSLGTQIKAGAGDDALRYHLAHADYRLGLLWGSSHARDAESVLAECVDQLKVSLERDPESVEFLVLQSACYAQLARYKTVAAVLDRTRAAERLNAAAKREPRNPRVVYFQALDALARTQRGTAEGERAYAELERAAELFAQTSSTNPDAPGWGHAQAYLELGRQLKSRGDIVGARNWIEKSLLMAPDYKAGQRELAGLMQR